jgi:uncharacterized repeat protein (TIGR02543 family)
MKKLFAISGLIILVLLFSGCPSPIENIPAEYTVTYDANGANNGTAPSDQVKTEGVNLTLATNSSSLEKSGFTFVCWNTAADGTATDYAEGASYSTDADLTLYAKWTALPTYNITYNANEGDLGEVPANQLKIKGTDIFLSYNSGALKRTEYIFKGWNTSANGLGEDYSVGSSYSIDEDLVLYAKWSYIGVKPIISDITFLGPTTIDTSLGDQVVTFTIAASDDLELKSAYVRLISESNSQYASAGVSITSSDYSGTESDGIFTFNITIPQYSESGTWSLYDIDIYDHLNQRLNYTRTSSEIVDNGWNYTFEQAGLGDLGAPTISSVTLEGPTTIDTSLGDQVVTFTITATDDVELKSAYIRLISESNSQYASAGVSITSSDYSGTDSSGIFTFNITIPQYSESGTWSLYDIDIYDHLNQRLNYTRTSSEIVDNGWNYTFEQTGLGD